MQITGNLEVDKLESISQYSKDLREKKISVVIPMYNEEKTIRKVLTNIPVLPNYEVIVVDDGSKDRCREIVKRIPGVKLICHEKNTGYGKSILDGVKSAHGDIIVTLDSDGQHDPRDIISLVKPILERNKDITIGSRYLGAYNYPLPFTSRIGEAFIEIVVQILFGKRIQANQGGFRAFKKESARLILNHERFVGFAFATETVLRTVIGGYKVEEVPIMLRQREHGKSRVRVVKLLFSLANCLLFYFLRKNCGKYVADKYMDLILKLHLDIFSKY